MEKKKDELNFEGSIKELEQIVQELESDKLDLDESMKKFEEGIKLSKRCNKFLEQAENKITILLKDENNEIKEEDF